MRNSEDGSIHLEDEGISNNEWTESESDGHVVWLRMWLQVWRLSIHHVTSTGLIHTNCPCQGHRN